MGAKTSKIVKSKTRKKRESYPYRKEYFKRNPGLFGCIWFCSQCGRILFGEKNVVVDHIVPLNKHGINRTFNTVAICGHCNSKKKDTVDSRVVRGYFAKIIEVIVFTIQKIVLLPIAFVAYCLKRIVNLLLTSLGGRVLMLGIAAIIILRLMGRL